MATALQLEATAPAQAEAEPRWYACYTKARHEKKVAAVLVERGIESYLPLVPKESRWKDRRKIVDWPMFPSYVFGRFALDTVDRVLSIPGVVSLVRAAGRPVAIDDEDLANVRLFAQGLHGGGVQLEERSYFAEGEQVEILSGPFEGVRGEVVEDRGRRRVLVGLRQIGQGTIVDVEAGTLRSLPAS